jgi:hypothetical protein
MGILVLLTFFLYSCGQRSIPQKLVGHWKTDKIGITVRTQDEKGKFEFTTDSSIISLMIKSDYTVDGFIGSAKFENRKIKTNWLLPTSMTGCAFTIECGLIGKIFENDPLDSKEVELWLGPFERDIDGELRYTQGGAHFPMAGFILTKGK